MSAPNLDNKFSGLHPLTSLPPDTQPSEQRVHEALSASLPTGWSAWHSLKVRTKTTQFSEADFVIADPERGILVLEVKGGIIRKEDGVWLQNGRPMKAQPLDQAHRFVRCLLAKYGEFGHVAPPIGVAVCFPDTPFETPPAQGDLQGIVLGARELPFLQELLPGFLERTFQTVRARTPSPGWGKFLHDLWCECWPAAMSLSCTVRDRAARRVRLDGDQFETLACVLDNDVVLVRGGAGTGKTVFYQGKIPKKIV